MKHVRSCRYFAFRHFNRQPMFCMADCCGPFHKLRNFRFFFFFCCWFDRRHAIICQWHIPSKQNKSTPNRRIFTLCGKALSNFNVQDFETCVCFFIIEKSVFWKCSNLIYFSADLLRQRRDGTVFLFNANRQTTKLSIDDDTHFAFGSYSSICFCLDAEHGTRIRHYDCW